MFLAIVLAQVGQESQTTSTGLEIALAPPLLKGFSVSRTLDYRVNLHRLVHMVARRYVHARRLYL